MFGQEIAFEDARIEVADERRHGGGDATRLDALQEGDGFWRVEVVDELADIRLNIVLYVAEL